MNKNNQGYQTTNADGSRTVKDPQPELLEQLYQYQKNKRILAWRRTGSVLFVLFLTAFASWQGYNYYVKHQLSSQVPTSIRGSTDFPVYIPRSNYKTVYKSYETSSGIISFKATDPDSEFLFTEQTQPADFELSRYTNGVGISETSEITTSNGPALLGKVHNQNVLIVSTQTTLITVISSADTSALKTLAHSLTKI